MSRWSLLAILVALAGSVSIVLTYPVLNNTFDEPAHLVGGLDWIEGSAMAEGTMHAPLARALIATGPYLAGVRAGSGPPARRETETLYAGGRYWRNLTLARVGTLPFYLLGILVVWMWARRLWGGGLALAAVTLFASLPPVLAHAGLATTDMAACATVGLALYLFTSWLDRPGVGRSLGLGVAVGIAVLAKISALVFLPAGATLILILRLTIGPRKGVGSPARLGLALLATVVVVWGGYRFEVGPLSNPARRPHDPIDRITGTSGPLHDLAYRVAEAPVFPAASFLRTLNEVRAWSERQVAFYILGHRLEGGSVWYFFPVALAVKTPLPFLLLAVLGAVALLRRSLREKEWIVASPLAAALGVLAPAMLSHAALGVRHILPIYIPLAVAGAGAFPLLARRFRGGWILPALLLSWQVTASVASEPDHIAYFNALVKHPEDVLVDSDLDWGQDLHRLALELQRDGVDEVSIAYYGTADLARSGLPAYRILNPGERATGWIAVSRTLLKMDPGYEWLDRRAPDRVVGGSIELHFVPEGG